MSCRYAFSDLYNSFATNSCSKYF
uniref:Uncharacterized protein n=1 Tax=Arundo donax TaxID=35708 RepID=A0A0A8Z2Q8_ARUDO